MNWITTTIEWNNNQTQIRDINVNEILVRGGHFDIKQSQLGTSII